MADSDEQERLNHFPSMFADKIFRKISRNGALLTIGFVSQYGSLLSKLFSRDAISLSTHSYLIAMYLDPVTPGLPELRSPLFETKRGNVTISVEEKIRTLSTGMLIIPVVALLVHISIGKYFGKRTSA